MISKEDFIVLHALCEKGYNISEISKLTKRDRKTVGKILNEVETASIIQNYRTAIKARAL